MKAILGQRYLFDDPGSAILILEAKSIRSFEIIKRIYCECGCCLNEGRKI